MHPNERPSFAEGPTTADVVDTGGLFRTLRVRVVTHSADNVTPPRVRVRS